MSFVSATTIKNDFLIDVSRGKVGDFRILSIAGHNLDIDTGAEEDLWPQGGSLVYLASEETMDIVSTEAADTSLLSLFISGVDSNYQDVFDIVVLDGLTPVTTAQAFFRVNFMFLSGTGSTNAGFITATASSAATVQCSMGIGKGISQHGFFTIPADKNAILLQVEINGAKIVGGGTPLLDFNIYVRFTPASPWISILNRRIDTSVSDSLVIPIPVSSVLSSGADIRFAAITDSSNSAGLLKVIGLLYDA